MRKRMRQTETFPEGEKQESGIPAREEKPPRDKGSVAGSKAGLTLQNCPSCGLKQGTGVAAKKGAACIRCGEPMDGAARDASEDAGAVDPVEAKREVEKAKRKREMDAVTPDEEVEAEVAAEAARPAVPGELQSKIDGVPKTRCEECKAPLTVTPLGSFYPCGHGGPKSPPARAVPDAVPDTVTVTWGEEKFTPVPYSTFTVGPFTATTVVRPGESRAVALRRAYADLELLALEMTAIKSRAFLAALTKVSK